jgi:hypothetical protein
VRSCLSVSVFSHGPQPLRFSSGAILEILTQLRFSATLVREFAASVCASDTSYQAVQRHSPLRAVSRCSQLRVLFLETTMAPHRRRSRKSALLVSFRSL